MAAGSLPGHGVRERLIREMAETCASRGYAATTVADVVAAAGVTRDDFHRHFRDLEECYLAAIDALLSEIVQITGASSSSDRPWYQTVREGAGRLLELLSRQPAMAKAGVLEALAAGPAALERYGTAKRMFTSLLDLGRADAPPDVELPASAPRIALNGAEALVIDELMADRTATLPELLPEVSYMAFVPFMEQEDAISRSGIGERARSEGPAVASGSGNGDAAGAAREAGGAAGGTPSASELLATELPGPGLRTDLMEAMLKVTVTEGYEAAAVGRVAAEAGVGSEQFYEQFPDPQSCLLATYDFILDHVVFSVAAAYDSAEEWPDRVRAALAALLDWFSAEPRMARLAIVGIPSAGPASHRHYRKTLERFLPLFVLALRYGPDDPPLPRSVARLALGTVTEMLFDEIYAGRTEQLPQRQPELVFATLLPYVGAREAVEEMKRTRAGMD